MRMPLFKMTSYTLGQKFIAPTKPERGVFPLDHEGREGYCLIID